MMAGNGKMRGKCIMISDTFEIKTLHLKLYETSMKHKLKYYLICIKNSLSFIHSANSNPRPSFL